ncbi:MAG: glycosyltransferase family 4 protein [Bacteroidales bacterium]|nr:glycosyltransferase family 4 protein [Bacteroidales bacterium]
MKKKIIRVATVALSLDVFCSAILEDMAKEYEVGIVAAESELLREVGRKTGVSAHGVEMKRQIAPWSDAKALLKMWRLLRREKPLCVHSLTPKAGLIAMVASRLAGVKVRVHTFTGLLFPTAKGWKRQAFRLSDWMICKCATHIIAEGQGVKDDLVRGVCPNKEVKILGNGNVRGVDLNHYSLAALAVTDLTRGRVELGIREQVVIFLYVGRFSIDKGIREMLQAFRLFCQRGHKGMLVMAGSRPDEDEILEGEIREIVPRWVTVLPWQKDVRWLYAMADCLVLPSRREGFPNVVLEAGAMGLPCIVTDVNGSREIIRSGVNGYVAPVNDYKAMARHMAAIASSGKMRRAMGANARAAVAQKFEAKFVRNCQMDFYAEVLDKMQA